MARKDMWPTPTADACVGSELTPEMAQRFRAKGFSGSFVEAMAARLMPTPTANRWDGLQSHGVNVVSGSLNPTWVEWLMGWPLGWTSLDVLGTDRFLEWRLLHGGF